MIANDALNNFYNQNVRNTAASPYVNEGKKAAASKAAEAHGEKAAAAAAGGEVKVNTDRVDFSRDAKVTNEKMSDSERAALVKSLKADLDNQMVRFTNMMTQMFQKQGIMGMTAQNDDFWKIIASGNYTVDAQTKAEAQQAVSEDGYWGVKQTSQRIFDFANAVAGDDPEKMKEMQAAVEKGFKQAEKAWGGEMPSITGDTHDAIDKLFQNYYEKAGKVEE